jgi:tetratricopeptide (TPR) repeat protein
MSYALNKSYKEAIADFQSIADSTESMNKKKILPIYINTAEMYFLIGCAQSQLANYPEAETAFQKALTEDYSYYMAHYYLADIYNKQGRFNDALGELDAALLVAPNDAIMHYNKAVFLFQMKKYADALDEYENTVKINPKLYKAHYNAAIIYEAMKNKAKALEYYQGFLNNAPLREEALIAKAKEKINALKNN